MNIKTCSLSSIYLISEVFSLKLCDSDQEGAICRSCDDGDIDRYDFNDVLMLTNCWNQYETEMDDYYFGMWINKFKSNILVYAEGLIKEYDFIKDIFLEKALIKMSAPLNYDAELHLYY